MKSLLITCLMLISFNIFALELKISKMSRDGEMERSFILKSNLSEKVVLDCQSFLQGLRIGSQEDGAFFMMGAEECESLVGRVRGSLRSFQKHCVDVEDEIRSDYSCH